MEQGQAFYRHAAHYLQVLKQAEQLYLGQGDAIRQGRDRFEMEWPNIRSGQAWAAGNSDTDHRAAVLSNEYAVSRLLDLRSPKERISWFEAAARAAQLLNDCVSEWTHIERLATEYYDLGTLDEEIRCYTRLAQLSREQADHRRLTSVLIRLGDAHYRNKQLQAAIHIYTESLVIVRQLGIRSDEGSVMAKLGESYRASGANEKAIECFNEACAAARDIGHPRREADALAQLAASLYVLMKREEAVACASKAVGIYDAIHSSSADEVRKQIAKWNSETHYSCFISYSSLDQVFADCLHADLQNRGIRCWFAPHDIQAGKKIHEQIDEAIRIYDRLLLILSEHSMDSQWVKTEIAHARQKEMNEKRQVLFPISLVPFEKIRNWKCFDADTGKDSAREIREYFIPDFSTWNDRISYQHAFQRLVRDLRAGENVTANADGE